MAGIAKRTLAPAILADKETATPRKVIGYASQDPGVSSQFDDLQAPICDAGLLSYISWAVQFGAVWYAIVTVCIVWTYDSDLHRQEGLFQMQQILAALNINRGTWAIAVSGSFFPVERLAALYVTTTLALVFEVIFIIRSFLIAWHLADEAAAANPANGSAEELGKAIIWILPALEAFVFIIGKIINQLKA